MHVHKQYMLAKQYNMSLQKHCLKYTSSRAFLKYIERENEQLVKDWLLEKTKTYILF